MGRARLGSHDETAEARRTRDHTLRLRPAIPRLQMGSTARAQLAHREEERAARHDGGGGEDDLARDAVHARELPEAREVGAVHRLVEVLLQRVAALELHLAAEGMTTVEISTRLTISPRTVEIHRANLMHKLNLHSQTDLIRFAIKRGILPIEE